jgi:hypothetical protein
MGQRLTQKIYECSLCNNIPEDGENLWQMGNEVWCEKCCDEQNKIANQDDANINNLKNK